MGPKELKNLIAILATALLAILLIASLFSSCSTILPGHAGIVFNRMTGNLKAVGQGIVFKTPFVTDVQSYPIALRTYTMVQKLKEGAYSEDDSIDLPTREGQHIKQDVSITYNTSPEKAAQVFKTFRGQSIEDIEATFIRRTAITVAQNVAGRMSLTELISQRRDDLQAGIQEALAVELGKMGFILDKVNLGASHLPEVIEKQMQNKMAAQQEAQQAEYALQKEQMLAKATVAKASGAAQATVIAAKAEAESNALLVRNLTPSLIEFKAIERWNGELPQVTGGAVPFVNLKTDKKQ